MNLDIPYAFEPRPDTGVSNATLGMWLFIASEVMLFGALFSAYALLRTGATSWPDQSSTLSVPLAALNTALMVASSIAIVMARRVLQQGLYSRFRLWLAGSIGCGSAFLIVKGVEYTAELGAGLVPATNNFLGLYYTLTGLHAAHVLGGLAVNLFLWSDRAMWRTAAARLRSRVGMAALYWNFIDVVWIAMFVVLYLI